jgi:hypothetical protein
MMFNLIDFAQDRWRALDSGEDQLPQRPESSLPRDPRPGHTRAWLHRHRRHRIPFQHGTTAETGADASRRLPTGNGRAFAEMADCVP